ncbi:MAG: hypothetical protein ACRDRU_16320 [Pseudonocardiaceae bacterium]
MQIRVNAQHGGGSNQYGRQEEEQQMIVMGNRFANSNLTDYQARRFRIRYRDGGKIHLPHTLSATGTPTVAVLAILENHAQPDGSVRIPEALRPYLGGQELIEPKAARAG